jgi:DNA repair photolyase
MPTLIDSRRNGLDFLSLPPGRERGRGARSNETSRHERFKHHVLDDGWESLADLPALKTSVTAEAAKSIITRNNSPDISFDRSINPYQGCEHGCSYCYARPTHANFGLSPGLDFESKLFAKTNAAELLRKELAAPGYRPATIALGANTDPYQPIEKRYRITRQILEVLSDYNHPVGIVTKSSLVVRDLDILKDMAERNLVKVAISITTLEPRLARAMEPRASTPGRRLQAVEMLAAAGVPVTVMVAPVVPALNDSEIEAVLKSAAAAGATQAGYVLCACRWKSATSSANGSPASSPTAPRTCSPSCARCARARTMTPPGAGARPAPGPMPGRSGGASRSPAAASGSTGARSACPQICSGTAAASREIS